MVCFDTPISRATSSAFRPASTCFTAPIICASVWALLLIRFSLSSSDYRTVCVRIAGGRSVTFTAKVYAPIVVGVPATIPALDNESPGGGDPEIKDQAYGGIPPLATRTCE